MKWRARLGLVVALLAIGVIAGCRGNPAGPTSGPASLGQHSPTAQAIARGVEFLVASQNPDGSWGTGTVTRGYEVTAMVPGSHDAYRVATTALCAMALREAGETQAHAKAVEYLITNGQARRDAGYLMYNIWAHTYALQALAIEMRHNDDPRIRTAAEWHIDMLRRYETYVGGWNYYDFHAQTQTPSMPATSFGTSAALVALWEARQSGLAIPPGLMERAQRRLEECRLPDGSFLYGWNYRYIPRHPANRPRGSIGRNQAGNFALWLIGSSIVGPDESREGLETFIKEHDFIQMGRKRQWPHESWYSTAGYYYYFGHYYAGRIIERLNGDERSRFAESVRSFILPYQEPDGSWWDYAMWDYHKPYGTAFAIMTLLRCDD